MILDKLENADWYYAAVPGFEQFMRFYRDNDLEDMPACKIKLNGDDFIVMIQDFQGKTMDDCCLESHHDYIDIQIPLTDDEIMGWRSQEDCQEVTADYDEGKDVELYGDAPATTFTVPEGHFVIFFPTDAHMPGIAPGKTYRKIIVKIKAE